MRLLVAPSSIWIVDLGDTSGQLAVVMIEAAIHVSNASGLVALYGADLVNPNASRLARLLIQWVKGAKHQVAKTVSPVLNAR